MTPGASPSRRGGHRVRFDDARSGALRGAALVTTVLFAMSVACDHAAAAGSAEGGEEKSNVKIRITIGDDVMSATLTDSAATRDFVSLLPLTLTLRDYAGTEKVSDLPSRLSTAGAPEGADPDVGDITYYAPWGNLAIFYRDFGFAKGLVKLGRIDAGTERLAKLRDGVSARFARDGDAR